jgi:hypothetical protein
MKLMILLSNENLIFLIYKFSVTVNNSVLLVSYKPIEPTPRFIGVIGAYNHVFPALRAAGSGAESGENGASFPVHHNELWC